MLMAWQDRLKDELHISRIETVMRGHEWDVADVMEVVRRVVDEEGLEPSRSKSTGT